MAVFRIPRQHVFPDPRLADPSGLLGVGGDLDPDRLLLAYRSGIFPWYSAKQPILWWSLDPRMVLFVEELVIPRSLAKRVRRAVYRLTADRAFSAVIASCARTPRPGQDGTWITPAILDAYTRLHERGFAHSIEAWKGDDLVGGLYGVAVGRYFSGESMFAHAPDASKFALVALVRQLERWGFPFVDCQVHTDLLERFGARQIPRVAFLDRVGALVDLPGRPEAWTLDADVLDGI